MPTRSLVATHRGQGLPALLAPSELQKVLMQCPFFRVFSVMQASVRIYSEVTVKKSLFSRALIAMRLGVFWISAMLLGASAPTVAQTSATFSMSKNLCAGVPTATGGSENCALANPVSAATPVYYVITLTNPWGVAAQNVALTDPYPAGFAPTANGMFCKSDLGAPVTITPNTAANGIGTVSLAANGTVHCFIPGSFTGTGAQNNIATGTGDKGGSASASANVNVLQAAPLPNDLTITKTSSPNIDLTTGAGTITYTITITNASGGDVNVGDYFTLYDNLSLPVNGVPLNVSLASASCVASAGTDCLNTAGPTVSGSSPTLVGTAAPKPFFSWSFAPGTGLIKAGGSITLTIVVNVTQLQGLSCIAAVNANGLRNTAFFNLTNATTNSALNDINPANNTATVLTGVETGHTDVIEGCGKGHLFVKKSVVEPLNPLPWGSSVKYLIYVKNLSAPNQSITINANDFRDWVTEGINTPPFGRRHIKTVCVSATSPAQCAAFNALPDADVRYNYYGHSQRGWVNAAPFTLAIGDDATFETEFVYEEPDCETVPNAPQRPIINTAVVSYLASPFGGPLSAPPVFFTQTASATVNMATQEACSFVVTKDFEKGTAAIEFGVPIYYKVTFTNNGAPRIVGTLMDAVRITKANYATSLPFNGKWSCSVTSGSVSGYNASGGFGPGAAVYTTTPPMGAPAADIGTDVKFGTNSTLTCNVAIIVDRPKFKDPFCTQDPVEFENLALMDVTNPFNNNIFWPPSSSYNPAAQLNPKPQDTNWATAKKLLPKCWDAIINKSASVASLPSTNAPWTYVGGPAVDYTIATTNTGQSPLGNPTSAVPGWVVTDSFTAPYTNAAVTTPGTCPTPSAWCYLAPPPHDGIKQIGIKNLNTNQTGNWNLSYPGAFTLNKPITNCARVEAKGVQAGTGVYQNSDPSVPIEACKTVPVIAVTQITTTKILVDQTGANVKVGGPYNFTVSCSPYPLPTLQSSFSLTTTGSGQSLPNVTQLVPMGSTCTVAETANPIPAASAAACGGEAYVGTTTTVTPLANPLDSENNNVTVTNTLKCKVGTVEVKKEIKGPVPAATLQFPNLLFNFTTSCTPAATPATFTISAGSTVGSASFDAPLGASCVLSEQVPSTIPTAFATYCAGLGLGAPRWLTPVFATSASVTATNPKTVVTVSNGWECGPKVDADIKIVKVITAPVGAPAIPSMAFTFTSACAPASTPLTTTLTTDGLSNNTASMIAPVGAACSFSETLPTIPATFSALACPNVATAANPSQPMMAVWDTPLFSPAQPMTVQAGTQTVTVNNKIVCKPAPTGTIKITKVVTGTGFNGATFPVVMVSSGNTWGGSVVGGTMFLITSNCSSAVTPANVSMPMNGSGIVTGAIGTTCTFSEVQPAFPTGYSVCAPGQTPVWDPPVVSPSGPVAISATQQTVTVTNPWHCDGTATAPITVVKVVQGPAGASAALPVRTYPITSTCGNVNITTNTTASAGPLTGALGTVCNFDEVPPPFTTGDAALCNTAGGPGTISWDAPIFNPASKSLTIGATAQTMTVTNVWKCTPLAPVTRSVSIVKTINTVGLSANNPFAMPAMPFVINPGCMSAGTLTTNGTAPTNTATYNVLVAASCTVTEAAPALPPNPYAMHACPNGGTLSWDPPVITPATLAASSTAQSVSVVNTLRCTPVVITNGSITVTKALSGPPGVTPPTGLNYTINSGCNPLGTSSASVTIAAGASGVFTPPVNAICNINENPPGPPPQHACPQGGFTWGTPVITPAGPLTVTAAAQSVTVTNPWSCTAIVPDKITVKKTVVGPANAPVMSAKAYLITSNCGNSSITTNTTGTAVTSVGGALGATCTFAETPPAFLPAEYATLCPISIAPGYGTPVWDSTSFSPSPSLTVLAFPNPQTLTVTNTWKCNLPTPPVTAIVGINKVVTGPSTGQLPNGLSYSISATCVGGGTVSPATVPVTTWASNSMTLPKGVACTFSETQPSIAALAGLCPQGQTPTWDQPSFSPPNPITVSGNSSLTVTNHWKCSGPTTGELRIYKLVTGSGVNNIAMPAATTYTITPICNAPTAPTSVSLTNNTVGPVQVAVGALCTFSETPPTFPTNVALCAPGQTPQWDLPTYAPTGTVTVAAGQQSIIVTNHWKCTGTATSTGEVVIKKIVAGPPQGGATLPIKTFTFTTTCGGGAPTNTTSIATNTTQTGSAFTVNAGTLCTATEGALPTLSAAEMTAACAGPTLGIFEWNPIPAAQTITVAASPPVNTITVTNSWKCIPAGRITIVKTVTGPTPIPAANYVIGATNCGSVTINTATTASNNTLIVATGKNCAFTEAQPLPVLPPSTACVGGRVAKWNTPVVTPSSFTVTNAPQTVTVQNTWTCQ